MNGTCLLQSNGFTWTTIEDNCNAGYHCQTPPQPGQPGEFDVVGCDQN
jgi:hypothetical protein